MNPAAASPVRCDHRTSLRIETACELSAVRAATLLVHDWLAEKGMSEADLGAWELALVEAANNAVKYAPPAARKLPVGIELSLGESDLEARITDHTAGFDWPENIQLPDPDAENGRGLFLIQSLTDSVIYLRHKSENVMVMRRRRPASAW